MIYTQLKIPGFVYKFNFERKFVPRITIKFMFIHSIYKTYEIFLFSFLLLILQLSQNVRENVYLSNKLLFQKPATESNENPFPKFTEKAQNFH